MLNEDHWYIVHHFFPHHMLFDVNFHTSSNQKMLNHANVLVDLEYILSHDDITVKEKVHFVINITQLI
jgi:hypothetical protein